MLHLDYDAEWNKNKMDKKKTNNCNLLLMISEL